MRWEWEGSALTAQDAVFTVFVQEALDQSRSAAQAPRRIEQQRGGDGGSHECRAALLPPAACCGAPCRIRPHFLVESCLWDGDRVAVIRGRDHRLRSSLLAVPCVASSPINFRGYGGPARTPYKATVMRSFCCCGSLPHNDGSRSAIWIFRTLVRRTCWIFATVLRSIRTSWSCVSGSWRSSLSSERVTC